MSAPPQPLHFPPLMSELWLVSLNSISPAPHPSISVSVSYTLSPPPHTHPLPLSLPPPPPPRMAERVSVGERARPLMHSWSLIKVSYTVRKCICAPAAAAPLRHRKWALGHRPIELFQGFVRSQSSEVWSANGSAALLLDAQISPTISLLLSRM